MEATTQLFKETYIEPSSHLYRNDIATYQALARFLKAEFGPNMKPGVAPSKEEAEELATLYPEIWHQYYLKRYDNL